MPDSPVIQIPASTTAGLYVAFAPTQERLDRGAKYATCKRCPAIVAHFPKDSFGHDIICLNCANDVPAIREHMDRLAKARG